MDDKHTGEDLADTTTPANHQNIPNESPSVDQKHAKNDEGKLEDNVPVHAEVAVKSESVTESVDGKAENEKKEVGKTAIDKDSESEKKSTTKIDVLLKAAGDAPIMKKKKWAVDADKPVAYLSQFIRKYIKCEPSESLFIYVNQTFVPSPDQVLSNLFKCFGSDGKLILHYCKSQAWG